MVGSFVSLVFMFTLPIQEVIDLYDERESNKIAWQRFVEYAMGKDHFFL